MTLIKKATASLALLALTSGMFVNGTSAYSTSEVEAASFLAAKWIVKSQDNVADYELDRQVLRQEIAALARGRADVEKTTTCENMFKDVSATKPNTWACYTVEALANAGLIAKNTNFRPEAKISKAEAIGMIVKAAYGNEYSPEAGKGDWQKQVVDFAVSKGIVSPFVDYKTPAKRGFVFEVTRKTYKDMDVVVEPKDPLCDLLGECPKEEPKKPESNNVVRNDSNLMVTLSPESPSNGMVVANTPRAKLLAFDVTAGKEDVTLRKASFKFVGSGNEKIVTDLAIYTDDVKLTRWTGTFNSKLESNISFDKNVVIKAGERKTLFVTATIDPSVNGTVANPVYNQMVRVMLTNLEASATVTGAELSGAILTPYKVSNKGTVKADSVRLGGNLYVGKEDTIYNLNLRENSKREDVVVKSFSLEKEANNTFDLENLANLSLSVNGKKVEATFTYQKDKIVVSLNETIKAGQRITLSLKGEAIDDLTKVLSIKAKDIYIVGASTWVATTVDEASINEVSKTITWTSVNFSFNKEGSNEVSPNSDDVKVGELVFVTNTDYTATVTVTVSGTGKAYYEGLELNGDNVTPVGDVYTFKNVDLLKGTTKLPLTIDVKDKTAQVNPTGKISFQVAVSNLRDEKLDTTVADSVLNNRSLTKSVTIVESGLTINDRIVNKTKVTPKNNPEVVLYKGSMNVNGSEDITINNMTFEWTKVATTLTLEQILSGVTLNIGGKTFNGNISDDKVLFNAVFATVAKGSKNVEFLVSWVLTDRVIADGVEEKISLTKISADLSAEKTTPTAIVDKVIASTEVSMVGKTALTVNKTNESSRTVVAGSENTVLGTFKLNSTTADIYVDELTVTYEATENSNTKFSSVSNIRLMDGSKELANWTLNTTDKKVVFEKFTLPTLTKTTTLSIVANLPAITTDGGLDKTFVWDVKFLQLNLTSDDATANAVDVTTNKVTVVPSKVTVSVNDRYGNKDEIATVKVTVSKDNKSELDSVKLKSLKLANGIAAKVKTVIIWNKTLNATDAEIFKTLDDTNGVAFKDGKEEDITDLNEFNIQIILDTAADVQNVYLNEVNLVSGDYTMSNNADNKVYLGSYTK